MCLIPCWISTRTAFNAGSETASMQNVDCLSTHSVDHEVSCLDNTLKPSMKKPDSSAMIWAGSDVLAQSLSVMESCTSVPS